MRPRFRRRRGYGVVQCHGMRAICGHQGAEYVLARINSQGTGEYSFAQGFCSEASAIPVHGLYVVRRFEMSHSVTWRALSTMLRAPRVVRIGRLSCWKTCM